MKLIFILIVATLILNAQTDVQISNLEISKHQVLGIEKINNKLFIVCYGGQGNAILDVYNMDKHTIENDILKDTEGKITFGNSNIYKDRLNNLWIGDVNRLIKIEPKVVSDEYNVTNFYKNIKLPDSTYFQIRCITEDNDGNIYFIKRNTKILESGVENGTTYSWVENNTQLIKFDGKNFNILKTIENTGLFEESIFYYNDKLYFSCSILGIKNDVLNVYDLKSNKYELKLFDTPTNKDIESLEWEEVKEFRINEIFEHQNQILLNVNIRASYSYFKTFAIIINDSYNLEFISPERDKEFDFIRGITSFGKNNDRIICSGFTYNGETRKFYEFKNNKFELLFFDKEINPKLITNSSVYEELKERKNKFEHGEFAFKDEICFDINGNLYGGTDKGLIFIENFVQATSTVETIEFEIKALPDLSNVKNELYIESEFNINSYKVFDINSRIVLTKSNLNSNSINLNLEGLTIGIYFIEIKTQKGKKLLKFIKN